MCGCWIRGSRKHGEECGRRCAAASGSSPSVVRSRALVPAKDPAPNRSGRGSSPRDRQQRTRRPQGAIQCNVWRLQRQGRRWWRVTRPREGWRARAPPRTGELGRHRKVCSLTARAGGSTGFGCPLFGDRCGDGCVRECQLPRPGLSSSWEEGGAQRDDAMEREEAQAGCRVRAASREPRHPRHETEGRRGRRAMWAHVSREEDRCARSTDPRPGLEPARGREGCARMKRAGDKDHLFCR